MESDIYGFASSDYISVDPYRSSCGVDVLKKNTDGEYEMVLDVDKLHGVAEKIIHMYYDNADSVYIFDNYGADVGQRDIRDTFADSRAAKSTLCIMELENESIRSMKDTFGVVPVPKYNAMQKEYGTMLHDQFIDNIYIDPGILYSLSLSAPHDKFRHIIGSMTNTVASDYKPINKQTQRARNAMNEKLQKPRGCE